MIKIKEEYSGLLIIGAIFVLGLLILALSAVYLHKHQKKVEPVKISEVAFSI